MIYMIHKWHHPIKQPMGFTTPGLTLHITCFLRLLSSMRSSDLIAFKLGSSHMFFVLCLCCCLCIFWLEHLSVLWWSTPFSTMMGFSWLRTRWLRWFEAYFLCHVWFLLFLQFLVTWCLIPGFGLHWVGFTSSVGQAICFMPYPNRLHLAWGIWVWHTKANSALVKLPPHSPFAKDCPMGYLEVVGSPANAGCNGTAPVQIGIWD